MVQHGGDGRLYSADADVGLIKSISLIRFRKPESRGAIRTAQATSSLQVARARRDAMVKAAGLTGELNRAFCVVILSQAGVINLNGTSLSHKPHRHTLFARV